jgi:hypothetical protein
MALYLVKNEPGTKDLEPPRPYTSWKIFWRTYAKKIFDLCPCRNVSCNNPVGKDGAHVRVFAKLEYSEKNLKITEFERSFVCIVPLCDLHNNEAREEPFVVEGPLVTTSNPHIIIP